MLNTKGGKIDQEPTTREILDAILDFSKKTDERFEKLEKKMDKGFADVRTELRAEMHDGLTGLRGEMQDGFENVKTELRGEMHDGFTNVRSDIRKLRSTLDELKVELDKLSKRTIEDSDVNSKDIFELQKKYKKFEIRLRKLEIQKLKR